MAAINNTVTEAYNASDKPFDFIPEGGKTVLVCEPDPSIRSRLVNILKELGWYITEQQSPRDALAKMRFHAYDMVVLNECFGTEDPGTNDVLNYLKHLPMSARRNIFVVLVNRRFRTMDNMASFTHSIDLVINEANIDDAGTIIKGAIADKEFFYSIFKESLEKIRQI